MKCLRTFPASSTDGTDGFTAQHLRDILAGALDEKLLNTVTNFVNVLLHGELSLPVSEIFFGGRLVALDKKDGGVRPIAVGYTLRRLAAKCVTRM